MGFSRSLFAALLGCLLLLVGCGGKGGASDPTGSSGVLISKATGGTVASGKAVVVIPPNALSADTKIWVQPAPGSLPTAPDKLQIVGGTAYDLSPNGTEFATPASLTLKYNPASLPTGVPESSITVYTVASGAWQLVTGSVVDPVAHTVSVPLAHFSVYAAVCPQFVGSGPIYDVVDLGVLNGDAGSIPSGISSDGKVVGTSTSAAGELHAFLWQNGSLMNLGHRTGDKYAKANAVNASGIAVGISLPDTSNAFPVKFDHGTVTQLETAFGLIGGSSTAINDNGDYIVGNAIAKGGTVTGFIGFTASLESGALNAAGDVAGTAGGHAAIWRSGVVVDAGVLPGYDLSDGVALSDNGILVGTADVTGVNKPVGFFYTGGTMTKMAPVTGDDILLPESVNNAGQVVGTSTLDYIGVRGFIYQNGVTQDLNNLISKISGWQILHAYAINNAGQIIAYGVNGGTQHAILLNPKS